MSDYGVLEALRCILEDATLEKDQHGNDDFDYILSECESAIESYYDARMQEQREEVTNE